MSVNTLCRRAFSATQTRLHLIVLSQFNIEMGRFMQKIITKYFENWNSHNVEALSSLFDEKITLKDWDISAHGIDQVTEANQKIFISAPKIRAEIIDISFNEKYTYANLIIHIDDDIKLNVIDVIKIRNGKIVSLSAYRQ